MIFVKIKRIVKTGFTNFWRNGWVSLATILVMIITLFVIGSLIFGNALLSYSLGQLQDKVDVTVYFRTDAKESDIFALKKSLENLGEVKKVDYLSQDDALKQFRERHADNSLILQSIDELGVNPLGASLNIKAKNPAQYESIASFLDTGVFPIIDKINYHQNKAVIDRLTGIFQASRNIGMGISLVLTLVALLVTFNTIRLVIYTNREEIKIMRLVGASNRYIRGPYVVVGMIYGLLSSLATMLLFYPITYWLGPFSEKFFAGLNLFDYYLLHFFEIFGLLLFIGVILGVFSSWIAARRYLKV